MSEDPKDPVPPVVLPYMLRNFKRYLTHKSGPDRGPTDPHRAVYGHHPYGGAGGHAYGSPYYGAYEDAGMLGSLDPFRIWRVLRRKWLTVALALLFAGGAAAFYLSRAERVYRTFVLMELSVRRPRVLAHQEALIEDQSGGLRAEEVFNTRLKQLEGDTMFEKVARQIEAQGLFEPTEDVNLKALLQRSMNLSLLRRTRLIRIEMDHPDPAFAAAVCNVFARTAEEAAFEENRTAADAAVAWLETQAKTHREELDKAEAALLQFRKDNRIDAHESTRRTVENAMLDFNRELVVVESRAAMAAEMLRAIESVEIHPEALGRLPSDIPRGDEIRAAMTQWTAAQSERETLSARYTKHHPAMNVVAGKLAMAEKQLVAELTRSRETAQANVTLLRRQADQLKEQKDRQSRLGSDLEMLIVEQKTRLDALERARNASEIAYRGILTRIQEARLSADEDTATIKVSEPATVPGNPIRPRVPVVLALALLLGGAGGLALALVTDTLDDRIYSVSDTVATLGLNALGAIPYEKTVSRKESALATLLHPQSPFAEAFAGVRAMLDSTTYRGKAAVMLMASSQPAEGKTVTACNLAITLAKGGKKTLLMDFDFRRPRLAGIFPIPQGTPGLLEYIANPPQQLQFESLAYSLEELPNLHVMASRPASRVPIHDTVTTPQVAQLIEWARATYDHIVIDAPPLGLVSDAIALGSQADLILLVLREKISRKRLARHTIERFMDAGIQQIAAVVNAVDFSRSAHDSPYYHYRKHYKSYMEDEGG